MRHRLGVKIHSKMSREFWTLIFRIVRSTSPTRTVRENERLIVSRRNNDGTAKRTFARAL